MRESASAHRRAAVERTGSPDSLAQNEGVAFWGMKMHRDALSGQVLSLFAIARGPGNVVQEFIFTSAITQKITSNFLCALNLHL